MQGDELFIGREPSNHIVLDVDSVSRRHARIDASGDGRTLDNGDKSTFSVKEGDLVLFTSYAGTDVKYQGDEYMIMREADVLAIIEG